MIRKCLCFLMLVMVANYCIAQDQVIDPDLSPMDMSYCPQDYPIMKFHQKSKGLKPKARVVYSRPQVKGRNMFGEEVKYNEIWRMGANENTEIEFFQPASIAGKKIAKGRYSLFCIPAADSWSLIINKGTDGWGAFSYSSSSDLARITLPIQKLGTAVEYLTMYFSADNSLNILWSDVKVTVPILFLAK